MSLHRRPVRVRLRGGFTLHGHIHVAEGQSLCGFLSAGRFFLNLTEVRREDDSEREELPHLSVRLRQIIWVEPLDPALRLSSAAIASEEARSIELHLEGGSRLRVELNVSSETRMSDYLDANPWFIPLWYVHIVGDERVVERVALNHFAILTIREVDTG
jgi:hypothetical protein